MHPALSDRRRRQELEQPFHVQRLGQHLLRPQQPRFGHQIGPTSRDHADARHRVTLLGRDTDRALHFGAVAVGKHQVQQHPLGAAVRQLAQRFGNGGRLTRGKPSLLEDQCDRPARDEVVLDDQHRPRRR